jgi:hypothetical protein
VSELPYQANEVLVPKIVRSMFDAATAKKALDEAIRHLAAAANSSTHGPGLSSAACCEPCFPQL